MARDELTGMKAAAAPADAAAAGSAAPSRAASVAARFTAVGFRPGACASVAASAQVVQRGSQAAAQHADVGHLVPCATPAGQLHSLQLSHQHAQHAHRLDCPQAVQAPL